MDAPTKRLAILGSTGSIGVQALDVAKRLQYPIAALAACRSVEALEQQIRQFQPQVAAMFDEQAANDLRTRVRDLPVRVLSGMDGLCENCRDGWRGYGSQCRSRHGRLTAHAVGSGSRA